MNYGIDENGIYSYSLESYKEYVVLFNSENTEKQFEHLVSGIKRGAVQGYKSELAAAVKLLKDYQV